MSRGCALLFALAACARPVAVAVPSPPPVVPLGVIPQAPLWPVAVRVMEWTHTGVRQVGVLPDGPPALPPTGRWYVEPIEPLDRAMFDRLVVALRSERVPGLSLRDQQAGEWLDELRDLPALTALLLDNTDVDDKTIEALAARWPQLEAISLEGTRTGDRAAVALAALPLLRAVTMADTKLTDTGGVALARVQTLDTVDFGRTKIGETTVVALSALPLRELFLDETRGGKALRLLAPLGATLVRFDASRPVGYAPRDADLAWLAQAAQLETIALAGTKISNALIAKLAVLPQLSEVDLAETSIDDTRAAQLLALPQLRMARFDKTTVGDRALVVPPTPGIEELYLSSTKVTDTGMVVLDSLPNLAALGLGGDARISTPTVKRIGAHAVLQTLVLSKASAFAVDYTAMLPSLTKLERLYLDETGADSDTCAALAGLHALRVLHLAGTQVAEDCVPALRELHGLVELTVGDTRVHTALDNLDAWPRLRTLSVAYLQLTDKEIAAYATRSSLVTLDLSVTEVTDPAPLLALPRLKTLGLVNTKLVATAPAVLAELQKRGVEIVR